MLQRTNRQWQLYPYKVTYTSRDEERTQWALPNKQWWTDTAELHEHITIKDFEEIEVTDNMQKRFEEIKDMPEDFGDLYTRYVLTGDTSMKEENEEGKMVERELPTGHPFNIVKLKNSDKEQGQSITDSEIKSMTQGQSQSDHEIRLIALEAK